MVHAKFKALQSQLEDRFLERESVIQGLLISAICPGPVGVFLLGPTGTAKTDIAQEIAKAIDWRSAYQLFNAQSTVEDVIGAVDVNALREGTFKRRIEGGLAASEIYIADEGFKCNASTLNAQLGPLADAQYRNGDEGVLDVPLQAYLMASNETPQEEGLEAYYDRLALRFFVDYVSPSSLEALVSRKVSGTFPEVTERLSADDVAAAWDEAKKLPVGSSVVQGVVKIFHQARQQAGVVCSDRRALRTIDLLRAHAWLAGNKSVGESSLRLLQDMLWDSPDMRAAIDGIVSDSIGRYEALCKELLDGAGDLTRSLKSLQKQKRTNQAGAVSSDADTQLELQIDQTVASAMGSLRDFRAYYDQIPSEWADTDPVGIKQSTKVKKALDLLQKTCTELSSDRLSAASSRFTI